jgi:hypothetical protein
MCLYLTVASAPLFDSQAQLGNKRCYRKAALMCLRVGDFAEASRLLAHKSLTDDAAACYISFLSACLQGQYEPAVDAIATLLTCTNFRLVFLYRAAQQAYESGLPRLFVYIMEKLAAAALQVDAIPEGLNILMVQRSLVRMAMGASSIEELSRFQCARSF